MIGAMLIPKTMLIVVRSISASRKVITSLLSSIQNMPTHSLQQIRELEYYIEVTLPNGMAGLG